MYPKDNPEIIIYAAIKKPNVGTSNMLSDAVTNLMKNIAKYKNMFETNSVANSNISKLTLDSYINQKVSDVKKIMDENKIQTVVIGDGDKIISQYPNKGEEVISYDKVFLITNGSQNIMPNIIGYTRSEVISLMQTLGYEYEIEGYGKVTEQSIKEGETVQGKIKITLG